VRGALQDGARFARLSELLPRFESGTTLYFSDCDAAAPEATRRCKVTDIEPAAGAAVSFVAELARDPLRMPGEDGAFAVTLRNRQGSGEASYAVALAYGGALTSQQLLTRLPLAAGGFTHQLLPFAFQLGGDLRAADAADWPLAAYYPERWYDFAAGRLREPAAADAFDNQCAGCHYTGYRLAGTAAAGFRASAVANAEGAYDADGDGRRDEINVGCESCHGPGSEHVEHAVRGARIVSPSLLTPERALLVCGRCHSRPLGIEATHSQAPLDARGVMPPPGLRRSEYLSAYVSRIDAAEGDLWPSGDSRSHHQQYTDLLRSSKHRNARLPMVCESCHDPHGSDEPHDLLRSAGDNRTCTECHAQNAFTDVRNHVERATGNRHEGSTVDELTCTACHMVDTARSGARRFALNDIFPGDARVQYMHGDVSSHRFGAIDRGEAGVQPTAFTQACAVCHGTLLPNP
jgi:predicted CXXCH cytochrome family protein